MKTEEFMKCLTSNTVLASFWGVSAPSLPIAKLKKLFSEEKYEEIDKILSALSVPVKYRIEPIRYYLMTDKNNESRRCEYGANHSNGLGVQISEEYDLSHYYWDGKNITDYSGDVVLLSEIMEAFSRHMKYVEGYVPDACPECGQDFHRVGHDGTILHFYCFSCGYEQKV